MSKPHLHPEFTGTGQLLLLIDFLRNVDQYEAKFRAIDDARIAANRALEGRLALGEIESARQQATIDRTTAMKLLDDARKRADEIITQAEQACAEMRAEADAFAKATTDGAKVDVSKMKDDLAAALASARRKEQDALKAIAGADACRASAEESIRCARELEQQAVAAREKFEQKFAALAGAVEAARE